MAEILPIRRKTLSNQSISEQPVLTEPLQTFFGKAMTSLLNTNPLWQFPQRQYEISVNKKLKLIRTLISIYFLQNQ